MNQAVLSPSLDTRRTGQELPIQGAASAAGRDWLALWLAAGLLWWLVGMPLLPSSKHYHQGLMALFWLPGVIALVRHASLRRAWRQPLAILLLLFTGWSALSWFWSPADIAGDETKIFPYVLLAANAVIALGCLAPALFWRTLALACLLNGLCAWVALGYFYGWQEHGWRDRVVGTGLLNHPILGAQVFTALAVLLAGLRRHLPAALRTWAWCLAGCGYLGFLVMCQSKGPWLAAAITVLLTPLWWRDTRAGVGVALFSALGLFAFWMWPDFMLQRGLSFRPELSDQAWLEFLRHPLQGIGFASGYVLKVGPDMIAFEHAHNVYLHIAIRLGAVGLALWLAMQLMAFWRTWRAHAEVEARALCALLCFAGLAMLTDGVGPWVKPREEWFCTWLPLFLVLAWLSIRRQARRADEAREVGGNHA
ncbi:O-antigen ligase family protein [Pseudomonas sp. RIT-PI-AD]|uniref:O-antigen ligase family protein n=1 Tax=Pseudomonas sp. RIT-PI-AD TaxID=3035294 RepID=UPI0021D8368F|nr:O-antigen ligase family protein [Pseudomonas sp. RIT-PI-AD]